MTFTEENTSRFVTIDGLKLHVHVAGSGPLLLLIHGGAPGAYGWGNFGQNMAVLAERFTTVIVDLPGYGKSDDAVFEGGRYAHHARVFAALIGELGAEKAHVVGMATGGAIAAAMAVNHSEVIDRLALVSSAGGLPLFTPMPSQGLQLIREYYRGEGPTRDKMRAYLEMMLYDSSLITDEIVEERYQASVERTTADAKPPVPEPVWTWLDKIAAPTLVMWGRDNRIQGYDNALFMLQRIPDVEVHIFGKTGLWIPFERKERFEALLLDFLNS